MELQRRRVSLLMSAALALFVVTIVGIPRVLSSPDLSDAESSSDLDGLRTSQPSRRKLVNTTRDACIDLTDGRTGTVVEGILGMVKSSRPQLARLGPRISLTCSYSKARRPGADRITITALSGQLSRRRFVRVVTFGVRPQPSPIKGAAGTMLWEWDPDYPEAGVLSTLHEGRVVIVQVAVSEAPPHDLRDSALAVARSLFPDVLPHQALGSRDGKDVVGSGRID